MNRRPLEVAVGTRVLSRVGSTDDGGNLVTQRDEEIGCRGEARRGETNRDQAKRNETKRNAETPDLPCERLFLDLVQLLEGLFREKPLQPLGRGSEMPRDAGSFEQAVRRHGRCRFDDASTGRKGANGGPRIIPNFRRVVRGRATPASDEANSHPVAVYESHKKKKKKKTTIFHL